MADRRRALFSLLALAGGGCAAPRDFVRPEPAPAWDPWPDAPAAGGGARDEVGAGAPDGGGAAAGPGPSLIRAYQRNLRSPVYACPMTPSCSTFSLQALDRFGPAVGILLTLDRMFVRAGHETPAHYDSVLVDGEARYLDPVPE